MEKNIKDYLHLYLGCEVLVPKQQYWFDISIKKKYGDKDQIEKLHSVSFAGDGTISTSYPDGGFMIFYPEDIKPILRPLSDMTEEEGIECEKLSNSENGGYYFAEKTKFLLSKQFDLFGLIEAGLAIDKTTL